MFTRKELEFSVKYPFSSATKSLAKWINFDFENPDPRLLERAKERVIKGIESGCTTAMANTHNEKILISEILSYPLAKIIVAKTKDKFLISKYAEAESRAFKNYLMHESSDNIGMLAQDFGFSIHDETIPFTDYLQYLPRDEKFKLVNAPLRDGKVRVSIDAITNLLPEKLKSQLEKDLSKPLDAPHLFETYASEVVKEVNRDKAFRTTENFGKVDVESFPPCIKALIADAQSGEPMAHQPRFILAAFLINIGMPIDQITELFSNTPNFNEKKTRYYIEYGMGKRGSGTKYSPPSCEKMVFYGLCRSKDALCSRVKHPLSYYSWKKKNANK